MDVWLDDTRANPYGWVWVKTVDEAIEYLKTGEVEYLSLDNDLGEGITEGREVVKWLWENDVWPKGIVIHSSNVVAVEYMAKMIDDSGCYDDGQSVFIHYYPATRYLRLDTL